MPKRLTPEERAKVFLEKKNKSKKKTQRIQINSKTWIEIGENDPRYNKSKN